MTDELMPPTLKDALALSAAIEKTIEGYPDGVVCSVTLAYAALAAVQLGFTAKQFATAAFQAFIAAVPRAGKS